MSCSYVKPWQAVERESDHLCIWKTENYLFTLVLLHGTWGYCWGIPWGWKKLWINTDTDTDTLARVSWTQTSLVLFILLSFFFFYQVLSPHSKATYKRQWSSASVLWSWPLRFCTVPLCLCLRGNGKKGNSGIETRNKDFFVKLRISYVTARQWMKHIVIHNHKRAALRSFDKWKLRDLNASPLVSTRSMHFLIKLKPASLRNAVTQHENRVDTSITVG